MFAVDAARRPSGGAFASPPNTYNENYSSIVELKRILFRKIRFFLIRNARFNGFNGIVAHFDDIRFVYSKAQSGLPLGVVV